MFNLSAEKDYLKSLQDSKELANTIRRFWNRKGFTEVRVWVDTESVGLEDVYVIRSNISKLNLLTNYK